MNVKLPFILAASLLSIGSAHAYSSAEFLKKCETAHIARENETVQQAVNRALDFGSCTGFVGGVVSGVDLMGNLMRGKGIVKQNFICLPEKKPANEILREVLDYIKANQSKQGSAPAQLSVYNALATAYPCKPREK